MIPTSYLSLERAIEAPLHQTSLFYSYVRRTLASILIAQSLANSWNLEFWNVIGVLEIDKRNGPTSRTLFCNLVVVVVVLLHTSLTSRLPNDMTAKEETNAEEQEATVPNMSLLDIIEGENERHIPIAKFVDDLEAFVNSFTPPASPELLIGAYSDLHAKYKSYEMTLTQKRKLSMISRVDCLVALLDSHRAPDTNTFCVFRTTLAAKSARAGAVTDVSKESIEKETGR